MDVVVDPVVQMTLRAVLALLLGTAAVHKLRDLARFREVLAAYEILPRAVVSGAAVAVPAVEATLAAAIASGASSAAGGGAACVLMLAYAAAIFVNLRRGRIGIDCGCMGPASRVPLGPGLVVRNLLLAAAAAFLMVPSSGRTLLWFDLAGVLAATSALSACWLAGERMLALAPRVAALRRRMS